MQNCISYLYDTSEGRQLRNWPRWANVGRKWSSGKCDIVLHGPVSFVRLQIRLNIDDLRSSRRGFLQTGARFRCDMAGRLNAIREHPFSGVKLKLWSPSLFSHRFASCGQQASNSLNNHPPRAYPPSPPPASPFYNRHRLTDVEDPVGRFDLKEARPSSKALTASDRRLDNNTCSSSEV